MFHLTPYLAAGASIAAFLGGILALAQAIVTRRSERRSRDTELLRWGEDVIATMATLEVIADAGRYRMAVFTDRDLVERMISASVLVDKGRLFFADQRGRQIEMLDSPDASDDRRPVLLDEVLKTHHAARHLAMHGLDEGKAIRERLWDSRVRFVSALQSEMGKSLKRISHIPQREASHHGHALDSGRRDRTAT